MGCNIFDIQKFSLQDGPGIRTTVFFKGCPLRCKWCHNPESWEGAPQLLFYRNKCVQCGICYQLCDNRKDITKCTACGRCVKTCPAQALEIKGQQYSINEIMKLILQDKKYYDSSGGGVTVSGGEPLLYPNEVKQLFTACKKNGIHTAVETCGYVKWESFTNILACTDLFLFDYKAHESVHKELTGVDAKLIRENLEKLLTRGANVILRCPLIPGINDSEAHLREIAQLSYRLPVEIMPYHNLGNTKAKAIEVSEYMYDIPAVNSEIKERWRNILTKFNANQFIMN